MRCETPYTINIDAATATIIITGFTDASTTAIVVVLPEDPSDDPPDVLPADPSALVFGPGCAPIVEGVTPPTGTPSFPGYVFLSHSTSNDDNLGLAWVPCG